MFKKIILDVHCNLLQLLNLQMYGYFSIHVFIVLRLVHLYEHFMFIFNVYLYLYSYHKKYITVINHSDILFIIAYYV